MNLKEYLFSKTKLMDKVKKVLRSRQFWTGVAIFVINGVDGIREIIPVEIIPYVNGVLGMLAVYFRISPRQKF